MQTRAQKHQQQKNKRRQLLQNVFSFFILSTVFIGVLFGYYGSKVNTFLNEISGDNGEENSVVMAERTKQIENLEPFAALILGIDIDPAGTSRSDTIILASVNPNDESMKLLSIPRDTLITLPSGQIEKINAAYTIGGPQLTKQLIEERFNIPIEFYAKMNFAGLVELVDAVGGITVDSEFAFTEKSHVNRNHIIQITEGEQRLDGTEALGYARMRKQDPRGDFGRQDRQKEVIEQILDELISFKTITNLTEVMEAVQPFLKTNATSNQILGIGSNYHSVIKDVDSFELNGEGGRTYFPHYNLNVYVWEPYEASIESVSKNFREHLELENSASETMSSSLDNLRYDRLTN